MSSLKFPSLQNTHGNNKPAEKVAPVTTTHQPAAQPGKTPEQGTPGNKP